MTIDDARIDAIDVHWVRDPPWSGTRVTDPSPELRVVKDYLTRTTWNDLPSLVAHVVNRQDLDINGSGFSFEDGTVTIHDPIEELTVTAPAFARLMLRFFLAVRAGADRGELLDREPWWPDFAARVAELRAQVAPDG